jgi:signal transduction histidine kinase
VNESASRPAHPAASAPLADAAAVRRVRIRLLLWSGGSTFVVLVALGSLLYAAVAGSLATAATDQLKERAGQMIEGLGAIPVSVPGDPNLIVTSPAQPGFILGGETSGTLAVVYGPNGVVAGTSKLSAILPDNGDLKEAVRTGQAVTSNVGVLGGELRVLTVPVDSPVGTFVVQVVGDRSAEIRTLGVLLTVLVGGGLVALAAALGVGWMYADRALVPIRDSMRRQREFAADASHELRTPLAIVKGSVDHLRRHPDRPVAEVGSALDDIEAGTDRLTALVDDLLLLARTDSGGVELDIGPVDLADIAIDAAGRLGSLAASHAVELRVDAEPVPIQGDAARLEQLVLILVDNAIRHAAAAGGPWVAIAVRAMDGRAVLTVDDAGHGIRDEDRERVFDRFWRASDAPAGGTGLGLAIARWIVERHDGSIGASNLPAGGARFEVRLPRQADPSAPAGRG